MIEIDAPSAFAGFVLMLLILGGCWLGLVLAGLW